MADGDMSHLARTSIRCLGQNLFRFFQRRSATGLQAKSVVHFLRLHTSTSRQPNSASTLDPTKLQHQDFIDISNLRRPHIQLALDTRPASHKTSHLELRYDGTAPFPPNSRGFLYYYTPPTHLPRLSGSIRFRLTKGKDLSDFENGIDLPNARTGLPWQISLPAIAGVEDSAPLRAKLLSEGLTSPETLEKSSSLWNQYIREQTRQRLPQPFLYYLEQPFHMRINTLSSRFWVVGRDNTLLKIVFSYTFCGSNGRINEDRGSGIFRFEKYGVGSRVYLALRLLKIVEPIRWNSEKDGSQVYRIRRPVEGELVQRRHSTRRFGPRLDLLFFLNTRNRGGLRELIAASNLRYSNFPSPSLSQGQGISL